MERDEGALRRLVGRVGAFYVTDKAMLAAQRAIEAAFVSGTPAEDATREYLAAVKRYFGGFEREARGHLRDVDTRLENANQVVFNLTAERAVAVKRIEATRGVLDDARGLEREPTT